MHGLVDMLPEPQRSLIVLFDLQGVDGATCARILDLSVNQVKVYLHRARRRLRIKLEQSP
ncbi:MAG TPA: sigma-70 region 4 domain-containing protein [Gammaproteobacteria bacterium]|nr:sigma-70 region 4 domain-containing protein [Gammaproteobacteria bacterium]